MAENTAMRNNALPYPVYGVAYVLVLPILDADGDPVVGAAALDSEISLNGDVMADGGTEAEVGNGMYSIALTDTNMSADIVLGVLKTSTADAKDTPFVLYPRKLVPLRSGTAQGGGSAFITLDASAGTLNDKWNGCLCVATIDGNKEARIIIDYNGSNEEATVSPDWNVIPDSDDTFIIYLPEGIQIPDGNIVAIEGVVATLGALADQYDGTGLTGDTFPSRQDQLSQIANVSGTAKRAPSAYSLTTGTQSANTVAATEELDGTRHEHTDAAGAMDLYYEFNIGSGLPSEVKFTGYLQGNNDDLEIYGWDWTSSSWKRIGTLNGKASATNEVNTYDVLIDMVGSGANEGLVRVRFFDGAFTLTSATLAIDQILVEFTVGIEGYEGGAVWLDTNVSNTNTVKGVDGIAGRPVSTIAAVNTLLSKTNLSRVQVAPQSSITFAVDQENQQFSGVNWTLDLNGKSVSGSSFSGADVSGIGTGAAEIRFEHCHFSSATLDPSDMERCVLEGTFTIGRAGDFFFENCSSGVAGSSTPVLDYGSGLGASDVNMRGYFGGIEIKNIGANAGTYNLSFDCPAGQIVFNVNCSADSVIELRGNHRLTNNATGLTINDDARIDVGQIAALSAAVVAAAVLDKLIADHVIAGSLSATIAALTPNADIKIDVTTISVDD